MYGLKSKSGKFREKGIVKGEIESIYRGHFISREERWKILSN